jgi:hypothetical protein
MLRVPEHHWHPALPVSHLRWFVMPWKTNPAA